MEKDGKEQGSVATELVLDTSGLRPIGSSFNKESDDSFAAEFARFSRAESNRLLETYDFSVKHSVYTDPSRLDMAMIANEFFDCLSESICSHMHEYLIQHEGRVKQWADPNIHTLYGFSNDEYPLQYNYFGKKIEGKYFDEGYSLKRSSMFRPEGLVYKNHYRHPESTPNALAAKLDRGFQLNNKLSQFIRKEKSAREEASSILKKAEDAAKDTESAKVGLIITGPLLLLALLATAIGFGLPLDLATPADSCFAFLKGLWRSGPSGLSWIGCALLSVFAYPLVGIMGITGVIGFLIQDLFTLGIWWAVIFLAVLWGIVLVVLYFLGFFDLFYKNPVPAAQNRYNKACAAYDQKMQEYRRMEQAFRATDEYRRAQEQDRINDANAQAEKERNEAFAERWQRAWFKAVQARGEG